MTMVLSSSREREAGSCSGWHPCAAHPGPILHHLQCCSILAVLMCALAHADDAVPERVADSQGVFGWDQPLQAQAAPAPVAEAPETLVAGADMPAGAPAFFSSAPEPVTIEYATRAPEPSSSLPLARGAGPDDDAPGLAAVDRDLVAVADRPRRLTLHMDDVTSAGGFVDSRVRTMALAVDAVVPRAGGLTIQPRLQLAYQPGMSPVSGVQAQGMPGDSSATGIGIRLYGAQPTRLAGIYPFVEADWWQDSRKQSININGTKIDADLLRGLFSFNIGAHGNTATGVKLWFKVKAGRNPGGTVGARYRW
ncbi:hydrolase [Cupriavidus consociatus]|uniref:hydrolase n=1 Tax=Cupriavidus consociatus TaxID=2821357 RepID=UPI001AE35687|nr:MULTISPECIES: hydrolase [unclassified Cupriavidus]MBP0619602.1 hydrolase [Cupriavidus sp. LEh25]MDK2656252.1 hydrolase [Cupriavidus sp. LEh21]